MKFPIKM